MEISPYKSGDFCKDKCDFYEENGLRKCSQQMFCGDCMAYQYHQYLRDHNQILEEGSPLMDLLTEKDRKLERLQNWLEAIQRTMMTSTPQEYKETQVLWAVSKALGGGA